MTHITIPAPRSTASRACRHLALALLLSLPVLAAEPEWTDLFNGKNLDGWERHSGKAEFHVEDAMTLKGIIALQIHRINDNQKPGQEVRWRNLRIMETQP